jgi:biotin-dependent carboxylase-like uncharacterized protein
MTALRVEASGPLALVQDLGRPGHATLGVTRSGAADRASLRLANRLVANAEGAAGIEVTFGGLRLRALGELTVAVAGAPVPVDVDGRSVDLRAPLRLRTGQTLALGIPEEGLRSYVAVRGGIEARELLGSRSRDTLAGVGPEPLREGDELEVGAMPHEVPTVDHAPVPPLGPATLGIVLGPRDDWFTDARAIAEGEWEVSSDSDRVGLRLARPRDGGPPLTRTDDAELASEGVVRGALQVPPGGAPVLFLADHPVTGGYPVIAVVVDADTDRAAQLRPGERLTFAIGTSQQRPREGFGGGVP